jgi:hypothetical protein
MITLHMREKHPIDELFRGVLKDAEATPPQAVWEDVMRGRHWGHRFLLQLERRWGWMLVLLLLLGGTAGWMFVREPDQLTERGRPVEQLSAVRKDLDPPEPASTHTAPPSDAIATSSSAGANIPVGSARSPGIMDNGARNDTREGQRTEGDHARARINTVDRKASYPMSATVSASTMPPGSEDISRSEDRHARDLSAGPATTDPADDPIERVQLDPVFGIRTVHHRSDPPAPELGPGKPVDQYVLPRGSSWLGLQFSYADVDGSWEGGAPLADELDRDEEWLDQWSAGLLIGRRWRSGASFAAGIDVTQRSSRFLHDEHVEGISTVVFDTTWVVTPAGVNDTVYTWNIETTVLSEPGSDQRYSATNHYTLLRIPLEAGWRREVRRWSYGIHGGIIFGTTISRRGQTSALSASDGSSAVVDLNDTPDTRFALSVAGSLALDAGYLLSERWSLHAGPVVSQDLWSVDSDAELRTSALGGFLRLEFELPMQEKKIPPPGME